MRRLGAAGWLLLCALVNALVLWLLAFPFADVWFSTDEGIYAYQAQRMLEGQVVYVDFFQFLTPGFLFLLAAWMKIAGMQIVSLRMLMILLMLATSIAIYVASRRLGVTPFFSLWPSLAFSVLRSRTNFELNHYGPSLLFEVSVLALLTGFVLTHRRRQLVAAGVLVSLDVLTSQHVGTHLLLGALLVLLFDSIRLQRRSWDWLASLSAGGLVPALAFSIYAAATGSLRAVFDCIVLRVLHGYAKFDTGDYWFHWIKVTAAQAASHPGVVTIYDLLLAIVEAFGAPVAVIVAAAYVGVRARQGRFGENRAPIAAAAIVAGSMFAGIYAAPNSLIPRVSLTGYVLLYALAHMAYRSWRSRSPRNALRSIASPAAAVSILFLFALPVRTAMVARNILRQHAETPMRSVATARGIIRLPVAADGGQIDVVRFLATNLEPGDPVFAVTWSPWVYYLGGYRNPTRMDYLLPILVDDRQVRDTIDALERARVEWIVEDSILRRNLDRRDGRFQALSYDVFETWEFFQFMRTHFVESARFGDYVIHRRRDVP